MWPAERTIPLAPPIRPFCRATRRTMRLPRRPSLLLLGLGLVQTEPALATRPEWEGLRGRPVAEIAILAQEVFDPTRPEESSRFFVWANALHIRTRNSVIRRELLFAEGDAFEPRLAEESERNLRKLGIFQDVLLSAEPQGAGVLVQVRTTDRWSTKVLAEINRQGGIIQLRLGLENSNLL